MSAIFFNSGTPRKPASVVHGSKETVRKKLRDIQDRYNVGEVLAVTAIRDFQNRLHSYELLSRVIDRGSDG